MNEENVGISSTNSSKKEMPEISELQIEPQNIIIFEYNRYQTVGIIKITLNSNARVNQN